MALAAAIVLALMAAAPHARGARSPLDDPWRKSNILDYARLSDGFDLTFDIARLSATRMFRDKDDPREAHLIRQQLKVIDRADRAVHRMLVAMDADLAGVAMWSRHDAEAPAIVKAALKAGKPPPRNAAWHELGRERVFELAARTTPHRDAEAHVDLACLAHMLRLDVDAARALARGVRLSKDPGRSCDGIEDVVMWSLRCYLPVMQRLENARPRIARAQAKEAQSLIEDATRKINRLKRGALAPDWPNVSECEAMLDDARLLGRVAGFDVDALIAELNTPSPMDRATDRGLDWLALVQEPDGSWSAIDTGGTGGVVEMTALAMLAFHACGHTEKTGRHKEVVRKAVSFLSEHQDARGRITETGEGAENDLTHVFAGLALSEAFCMARVRRTGELAQAAVDWSVTHQRCADGGWSVEPVGRADVMASVWYMHQIVSAKQGGLKVPLGILDESRAYLDRTAERALGQPDTETLDVTGLLAARFLAGAKRDEPLQVRLAGRLRTSVPRWAAETARVDLDLWFLGTRGMFVASGQSWRAWQGPIREALLARQDECGSWSPPGDARCRARSTAMGVLTISVYYRYLPLFKL
ncbi:MAG: hypothetical protein ACYTKD_02070 [Planctomycetota bacterium]|jgi:hypothetical protein